MISKLRRLRLKEGDVIVVRDHETADAIMAIKSKHIPPCPIIIAPNGIHRLSKDYLQKLIAKIS